MVPSLQDNPQGQAHSRVPECDGRPSVQINQVQSTESLLHPLVFKLICQVVHSLCGPIRHTSEPQIFHCTYLLSLINLPGT